MKLLTKQFRPGQQFCDSTTWYSAQRIFLTVDVRTWLPVCMQSGWLPKTSNGIKTHTCLALSAAQTLRTSYDVALVSFFRSPFRLETPGKGLGLAYPADYAICHGPRCQPQPDTQMLFTSDSVYYWKMEHRDIVSSLYAACQATEVNWQNYTSAKFTETHVHQNTAITYT